MNIVWLLTLLACFPAGLIVGSAFLADSAPQQAAAGALGAAIVVIPYVFARSIERMNADRSQRRQIELLEQIAKQVPRPPA